jgi:hypothetical protein
VAYDVLWRVVRNDLSPLYNACQEELQTGEQRSGGEDPWLRLVTAVMRGVADPLRGLHGPGVFACGGEMTNGPIELTGVGGLLPTARGTSG